MWGVFKSSRCRGRGGLSPWYYNNLILPRRQWGWIRLPCLSDMRVDTIGSEKRSFEIPVTWFAKSTERISRVSERERERGMLVFKMHISGQIITCISVQSFTTPASSSSSPHRLKRRASLFGCVIIPFEVHRWWQTFPSIAKVLDKPRNLNFVRPRRRSVGFIWVSFLVQSVEGEVGRHQHHQALHQNTQHLHLSTPQRRSPRPV